MADTLLPVRVTPNAGRTECQGLMDDGATWKIKLAAPAVDGKANAALVEFLADMLDLAKSAVEIVRGTTARQKVVRLSGISDQQVGEILGQRKLNKKS